MQYNIFGEVEREFLNTNRAAILMGVSTATIHNWVKTGYLQTSNNGWVSRDSVNLFIENFLGKEKLNARANKLQKDEHNHQSLSENFLKKLHSATFNDNLWQDYENSLSESYRNKEGIYYTPTDIVVDMFKSIENVEDKTFLDPCCGGGNFLMQALEMGFKPENVYGFDTDQNAVEITKKRFFEKTGFTTNNIICNDFQRNDLITYL